MPARKGVSMAMGDYICCGKCNCKMIIEGPADEAAPMVAAVCGARSA